MVVRTELKVSAVEPESCCSQTVVNALDDVAASRLARAFKALGDPTRIQLISLIAATDDGEACICDLTDPVGLSQPTVSHHMRILVEAGLVSRERRGKWAYFSLVGETFNFLRESIDLKAESDR